jgi:hypothetical protein
MSQGTFMPCVASALWCIRVDVIGVLSYIQGVYNLELIAVTVAPSQSHPYAFPFSNEKAAGRAPRHLAK